MNITKQINYTFDFKNAAIELVKRLKDLNQDNTNCTILIGDFEYNITLSQYTTFKTIEASYREFEQVYFDYIVER